MGFCAADRQPDEPCFHRLSVSWRDGGNGRDRAHDGHVWGRPASQDHSAGRSQGRGGPQHPGHGWGAEAWRRSLAGPCPGAAPGRGGRPDRRATLIEDALAGEPLGHDPGSPRSWWISPRSRGSWATSPRRSAQLRRAYAIIVASAGPEHATALSIEGRLAAVTYRLGEPTEAYDWHLADVGLRVLGPDHPAVRGAQARAWPAAPRPGGPDADRSSVARVMTLGFEDDPTRARPRPDERSATPDATPPRPSSRAQLDGPNRPYRTRGVPTAGRRRRGRRHDAPARGGAAVRPSTLRRGRPYRRRGLRSSRCRSLVAMLAPAPDPPSSVRRSIAGPTPPRPGRGHCTRAIRPSAPATATAPDHASGRRRPGHAQGRRRLGHADLERSERRRMSPFIVAGGRDGEPFKALESVPAGRTTSDDLRAQHRLQLLLHGRRRSGPPT